MEGLVECENLWLSGVERRYLEGIFIGLGSAVAEEKRIVVIAAELAELCGELLLK